jgi:DNA-binding LacI/PurR family transcriptional regulator
MASRGRRKSVGVVEMARDLGVSTATVSRALNGSPSVRGELADRIRAHAQTRGYVANRLTRALSARTSRAFVGFVIPYAAARCRWVPPTRSAAAAVGSPATGRSWSTVTPRGSCADPPLTMVQVPYAGLARNAARLLLRALDARDVGAEPPAAGPHQVAAGLRIAGSTGPPPHLPYCQNTRSHL